MAFVNKGDKFQSFSDLLGKKICFGFVKTFTCFVLGGFMFFFGGFGMIGNALSIFVLLKKVPNI